jgi:LacI family transcriptional regulator
VDLPDSRRLCYVGTDYQEGGRLAGEAIWRMAGSGSRVGIVSDDIYRAGGNIHALNAVRRESGFSQEARARGQEFEFEPVILHPRMSREAMRARVRDLMDRELAGLYYISILHEPLYEILDSLPDPPPFPIVIHDRRPEIDRLLEARKLTAVIYQNPVLQGYYTVKVLEHVLEAGVPPPEREINLVHNLILNANKEMYRNHYLMTRLDDED